ncbi:efflux RND transporter periplasmic adaptor subunit [Methylocaldum marinum]|nr:efflux RND transporter periplasmic adaptor subunit [Methylocaldum marinum]
MHRHEPGHAHEHDHDEEHLVRLSASQLELVGIRVVAAQPGRLAMTLNLPGQIAINADRLAHVVPRVAGVVAEVRKTLGDSVEAGEVMAVIDSRELAESRAAYLAACKQAELASATFRRKEILWKEEIIPKQVYQEAKLALAVARVEEHTVEQKLLAMGISLQQLHVLRREPLESLHPHEELSRYEIAAPFAGTILERHITLGEAVQPDAPIFLLGDLSTVWVDLNVYPKDLPRVRSGQTVTIGIGDEGPDTRGKIIHVQPLINEETRRTFARAEIDNRDGRWQPGLFVTGRLETGSVEVPVRVARTALQSIKSHEFAGTGFEPAHAGPGQTVKGLLQTVVFVREDEGFEPRPVVIGRGDDRYVEVVGGLEPGELYAETGSFILKAELEKGEATHEH